MLTHLWTGAPAPIEYTMVQLCRDMHCTPTQLRAMPLRDIGAWLAVANAEEKVRVKRAKTRRKTKYGR